MCVCVSANPGYVNTHLERDARNSNCNDAINGTTYDTRRRQRSLLRASDPNLVGAFRSGQLVLFEPGLSQPDEGLASTGSVTHG